METSRRKHYTQMTVQETNNVQKAVRKLGKVKVTAYVKNRMQERNVQVIDIAQTIAFGKVIEVHNNKANEIRVLLQFITKGKRCHAVVSLTDKTLVTCYWNDLNDTHKTLDKNLYKWNVDLMQVV